MAVLVSLIIAAAVIGAGCIVGAVFLLAGGAWALLSGGIFLILSAALLRKALPVNG